ncbi:MULTISPECIES: hypothetical protein [Pseudomonas]|uniref:hypothetical protein n=1 Tax=Pseudomonas TaxID=286 RepID=UPI00111C8D74|nr:MULTISPECIES: hypothetical protein [Pseudomonas]
MHDYFSCGDLFVFLKASALRMVRWGGCGAPTRRIPGGRSILQTKPEAFNRFWSETKSKLQVTL